MAYISDHQGRYIRVWHVSVIRSVFLSTETEGFDCILIETSRFLHNAVASLKEFDVPFNFAVYGKVSSTSCQKMRRKHAQGQVHILETVQVFNLTTSAKLFAWPIDRDVHITA